MCFKLSVWADYNVAQQNKIITYKIVAYQLSVCRFELLYSHKINFVAKLLIQMTTTQPSLKDTLKLTVF